jgi:hypothetical protein
MGVEGGVPHIPRPHFIEKLTKSTVWPHHIGMSEELYPEAQKFNQFMKRKLRDPLDELPNIPNDATLDEAAKIYEPLALESLATIASDERQPASARVAASKEILDRSAGKATQKVEHGVS